MKTLQLRTLLIAVPLVGLFGLLQCGSEGDSGNTNWLKFCHETSECGPYVCECGRCENVCTGSIDCSLSPGAICTTGGVPEGGVEVGPPLAPDASAPATMGDSAGSSVDGIASSTEPCGPVAAAPVALAASPSGLLAVGYADGVVTLHGESLVTTCEIQTPDAISSLALSPDGTLLASASIDPEIRMWSTADGHQIGTLPWTDHATTDSSTALSFSADGKVLLASASSAPEANSSRVTTIFQVATGKATWSRTDAWESVASFADAGAAVLIADQSHAAIYDLGDGRLLRQGSLNGLSGAPGVSSAGAYLVDWEPPPSSDVVIVRTSDFREAYRLDATASGSSQFFSADDSLLLMTSMFGPSAASMAAIPVGTWGPPGAWTVPDDSWRMDTVWKIAPAWGQKVVVIDTAGRISLIGADLQSGITATALGRGPRYSMTLRYAPGGAFFASAGDDTRDTDALVVWSTQSHKVLWSLNDVARSGPRPSPNAFAFSADGKTIYAASDGPTRALDAATGTMVSQIGKHANCVATSPDGATLYACESSGAMNSVVAYGTSDGSLGPTVESDLGYVAGLAVSPDGTFLAIVAQNGDVVLYRRDNLQQIWKAKGLDQGKAPWVVFSPDGKTLAVTWRATPGMLIWDAASGKELGRFKPTERMGQADFSPDGRLIAVGDEDGVDVVRLSDMTVVQTMLPGQGHGLSGLAFGPAGDRLLLGGGTITSACGVSGGKATK